MMETSPLIDGAAEAFYRIFRTLPPEDRAAITQYILADEDVQKTLGLLEIPNVDTIQAFAESRQNTAFFDTVDALRADLLS
ncbi:MAG: hypothetical protein M5U34_10895 [Chloroflexi bacterium]|jgi:hypothetical protein|nr:hypothetical protein [Chloroflexota bacterium]